MDRTTFEYLRPTEAQLADMAVVREAAREYFTVIDNVIPDGPDKTYLVRKLREVSMWANIAITRHADGAPRE